MDARHTCEVLTSQYEAALSMLLWCVESCPDEAWDAPVVNMTFCQAAFHALFFCDYYLGDPDEATFRAQAFHQAHADVFRDYEELEDRAQVLMYERDWVALYGEHCAKKMRDVLSRATGESLAAACGFARRPFSRLELHVVNVRHVQHHAGQLGIVLRERFELGLPWAQAGLI